MSLEEVMEAMNQKNLVPLTLAKQVKLLSSPTSLALLRVLREHEGESIGVRRLAAMVAEETGRQKLSQPGLSHHLRMLYDAGLLLHERRTYSVCMSEIERVLGTLCTYTGITQANGRGLEPAGKAEP